MEKQYTISEVADKLNVSSKTLRRWESDGKISPPRTIGGQRRYTIEDLQILDAIKHGTIPSQSDLLTVDQAAGLFGVTPQTIVRWENLGKIHPFVTKSNTYYSKTALSKKIAELKRTYNAEPEVNTSSPTILHSPRALQSSEPAYHSKPEPSETPRPKPTLSTLKRPEKPSSLTKPSISPSLINTLFINIFATLIILFLYHLLTGSKTPISPSQNAIETTKEPTAMEKLLTNILDATGNLTIPGLLTAKKSLQVGNSLTLSPSTKPGDTPGTLYYDAGSQTLKFFTNGNWYDFPAPTNLPVPENSSIVTAKGSIAKNKDQSVITDNSIKADSLILINMNSNFAPAKKYWVTQTTGQFTLHTDFPVANETTFTYSIINPTTESMSDTQSPPPHSPADEPSPAVEGTSSAELP